MPGRDYSWYETAEPRSLEQGDFLFGFDVGTVTDLKSEPPQVDIDTINAVVMSQSCDILDGAFEYIVLCPVWSLAEAADFDPKFATRDFLEKVRKNQVVAFYLLNKCNLPGYECDFRLVQFERVIVVPKKIVSEALLASENHLRLLPPYREQMAQRFGGFFSRVACPIEIPKFP